MAQEAIVTVENTQRSDDFRVIYTNAMKQRISAFDLTLTFGRQGEIAPGQEGMIELIAIVMSPQHMKAFALGMASAVAQFEAEFGAIPLGPGINLAGSAKS